MTPPGDITPDTKVATLLRDYFGRRLRLESGKLGITAVTNLEPVKDVADDLLSRPGSHQDWETASYRLESDETILAGVDGKAREFNSPLDASIEHRALKVLVPAGTEAGYVSRGQAVSAKVLDIAHLGGEADE